MLLIALLQWHTADPLKFVCYLAIAILASTLKVSLPGIESTMSVYFLFIFLGVLELSLAETLVIGCTAALVQSVWKTEQRPELIKVVFNVVSMTPPAICATYFAYHLSAGVLHKSTPLLLLVTASTYFLANTAPVAIVIAMCSKTSIWGVWKQTQFWSLPYYLSGAAIVGLVNATNHHLSSQSGLLILPIMYVMYRSCHLYMVRLQEESRRVEIEAAHVLSEKRHVEAICALHLRTIEGLSLVIDAKDHNTHQHLNRVRTYAVAVGRELGLDEQEMDALQAAALLHDIGKLAVPDHIINKPGRLSPEEFEKMKIHPIIGAEILERVSFPYPVAPIVRSHHEKWNGSGYPDGLKGEEIPIGARILAAVDCLDAEASDRPYRRALPLDDAMKVVASEAGKSFDPKVVEILQRRYVELEAEAISGLGDLAIDPLSYNQTVGRGESPSAGFERVGKLHQSIKIDFLSSIAYARHEAHTLFELAQDLGKSLSLNDTLSLFAMGLQKLIPYDTMVVFIRKGDILTPEFVSGENFRLFSSLEIPVGKGLCGWVAHNSQPIVNGNPEVEISFAHDLTGAKKAHSALAVPLNGLAGQVGVVSLFQSDADAFTNEHLRVLQAISATVALSIENALKYREAETSATIDYLTGLANARDLSVHLQNELERCNREHSTVAVMVCDLNGFKKINDCHGHLTGDKVLKVFADSMRGAFRKYDYLARMGGDEFVLISTNLMPDSISGTTLCLNALASAACVEVCGKDSLSLSLGAAFYPQDGTSAEQLLTKADMEMYAAKKRFYQDQGGILEPVQPTIDTAEDFVDLFSSGIPQLPNARVPTPI